MTRQSILSGIGRLGALTLVLWLVLTGLGMVVRLAPGLPPLAVAISLALLAGTFVRIHAYEARTLTRRKARTLIVLRLGALALLAWILLEPTIVRKVNHRLDRQIAILWDQSASMQLNDAGDPRTRAAIARDAMTRADVIKALGQHARVREISFARSSGTPADGVTNGWDQATDIAAALDSVLTQIPPDELAGAVMLTDGRHNRLARPEDGARRFGVLDAPLGIVAIGSAEPPRDAAVLAVRAPDAIHLGDRIRVSADLKFDGYMGAQAMVRLTTGNTLIEEKTITIPKDQHREEVRFTHLPEQGGTGDYQIEIQPLRDERFAANNKAGFETTITEARTNVLLVDAYPRWEFRYLRNLFYGRDKSIHLQWLLLHPDQVAGQAPVDVAASAARPFGQAAATRLPENESEWRKFDVIILGDLPADAIAPATWAMINRCVNERGALLVFLAGPNHMPHALDDPVARGLLPVDPIWSHRTLFGETTNPFRFALASEGRRHPVTQHAAGAAANEQVWASFPAMQWRHPLAGVKDGADILLTAVDDGTPSAAPNSSDTLGASLDDLARRREREAQNALLVVRQTGRGKVAAVLTDRTWRLREGAGDLYHHRFWSNLVRWGAGPLLRAGSNTVALGTDQLTYTPDDPVAITARLRDAGLNPLVDPRMGAEITRDGEVIASIPLTPVENSNGLHEGMAAPLLAPGTYTVRLTGDMAGGLLAADGKNTLSTRIRVVGMRTPVELAETTLDRPLLDELARASGGMVVGPDEIATLLPMFAKTKAAREEIRETPLWDNAIVFAVLAILLAAEWWTRRGHGLP